MPPTPRRLILDIQDDRLVTALYPSDDQRRYFAVKLLQEALISFVVLSLEHFLKLHFGGYRPLTRVEDNRTRLQNVLGAVINATKKSEMYGPL
ncbi:hypothetical protein FRC17_008793, partial [Serendipita sp. 399]